MTEPYRYVPSSVSEIKDFLGYMVLSAPDNFPEGETLDEEYDLMFECLGIVRKRIGEARYDQLIDMAQRSKQLFVDGNDLAARAMLANMKEVVSGREPKYE